MSLYADTAFYDVGAEAKNIRFNSVGKIGIDGTGTKVQYSSDNVNWHDTYVSGDIYIRTGSKAAGAADYTYQTGTKFVPVKGTDYFDGTPGLRGSKWAYIDATSFVQATVDAYFTTNYGGKVAGDTVTVYNAATSFSQTWIWNGSAWTQVTVVIDGSLLVTGTVAGNKLTSDFLETRWATIGTLKSAASGSRVEIKSNVIKVFEGETLRVRIGNLSA